MSLWLFLSLALQSSTPSAPATFVTAAEAEAVLKEQIPKNVVDQPIKLSEVPGGKASVASLHRSQARDERPHPQRGHRDVLHREGERHDRDRGKPGRSQADRPHARERGDEPDRHATGRHARRVGPGDIIIIPAGTAHSFSELDGPISYLVFRFEPKR